VLRRVNPRSEALLKEGEDSFSSFEERSLVGSVAALWMLKSRATRYGRSRSRRACSGETECGHGRRGLA